MRILITAGPTHEPIDGVRYIGNRSSGKMGVAIAESALAGGHDVTLIAGPLTIPHPIATRRIDVQTAAQMSAAVHAEFQGCQLLIMAAAVADWRPRAVQSGKLRRSGTLVIECEPTADIVAAMGSLKRPDQRIVGFSLEQDGEISRAYEKLLSKKLDMMVFNPIATMESDTITPVLLWSGGRREIIHSIYKRAFADILLERAVGLF